MHSPARPQVDRAQVDGRRIGRRARLVGVLHGGRAIGRVPPLMQPRGGREVGDCGRRTAANYPQPEAGVIRVVKLAPNLELARAGLLLSAGHDLGAASVVRIVDVDLETVRIGCNDRQLVVELKVMLDGLAVQAGPVLPLQPEHVVAVRVGRAPTETLAVRSIPDGKPQVVIDTAGEGAVIGMEPVWRIDPARGCRFRAVAPGRCLRRG